MAAAMAAAASAASAGLAVSVNPLPRFSSSRTQGLCLNSLVQPTCLRSHVVSGCRAVRRLPGRPYALAEQQASSAEVEQADEEKIDVAVEDDTPEANGNDAKASEAPASITEVLLRSYCEAVKTNDQASMSNIQAQLEVVQKEKDSLGQLVASLTEEVSLSKERLLRLNADFDNFRKRSDREKVSLRETVKGDVIESLLPMIDNFERAKGAIKAETEGEKKIDSSYQGIYKQFVDIMKGLGVSVTETVGKEFNPELHEAIMREESNEFTEGIISQEFRRGFMLGDKLLRPAMVKVSAGKITAKPSSDPAAGETKAGAQSEAAPQAEENGS